MTNLFSQLIKLKRFKLIPFKKGTRIVFALLTAMILSGCVTALVAGAVITTVDVIHDRRTVGEYIDDGAIEVTARNIKRSDSDIREASRVKVQSWNGILLMTGEVTDEATKQILVSKYSNIKGVRQVVDETSVDNKTPFLKRSNDVWIANKVKSRMVIKTGLDANRVKVVTTRGTVYLMGIVTQDEADKATEIAQKTRGVKRVVKVFEYTET